VLACAVTIAAVGRSSAGGRRATVGVGLVLGFPAMRPTGALILGSPRRRARAPPQRVRAVASQSVLTWPSSLRSASAWSCCFNVRACNIDSLAAPRADVAGLGAVSFQVAKRSDGALGSRAARSPQPFSKRQSLAATHPPASPRPRGVRLLGYITGMTPSTARCRHSPPLPTRGWPLCVGDRFIFADSERCPLSAHLDRCVTCLFMLGCAIVCAAHAFAHTRDFALPTRSSATFRRA